MIDLQDRKKILAKIDLFQSFSDSELSQFAENISEVTFDQGEVIFTEDDPGDSMFILLDGTISIFKNSRFITSLGPNDYLGEMAIIEDKLRSATAQATSPARLLQVSAQLFKEYLSRQPHSLVSMMKTLSERIRSDTDLIAKQFQRANILVHDMSNRLSSFLLLDLIDDKSLSDETKKYLHIMADSFSDLSIMMSEALANAKRLKINQSPNKSSISKLLQELNNSEFLLHSSLKDKKIHLDFPLDLDDFYFHIIDIRRVITNLVINAGQASPANADIHIKVAEQDGCVKVSVQDQGSGIAAEIQPKIYNPHFTTKPEGNGLGLTSCKEIIEIKHHGQLQFETSEKGTTFHFTLPYNCDYID